MLFTETAHFVVNFLLSRRPRATPPHRLDQELCFWGCRGPALPAPASRRSLGDYWLSPQRRRPPGAAWRWPTRNLLLLPGATGLADVPSARWPSCYSARPRLTWKHRWQNINYQFLGKRKRHLVPLRPNPGRQASGSLHDGPEADWVPDQEEQEEF